MPFYEVQHSAPLTVTQRSDIAKGITRLYNETFNAPSMFVNVCFVPVKDEDYYCGGNRKLGTNRILQRVEDIWNNIVGVDRDKVLSGIFITPGLIAREHGFMVPPVGEDGKWLQQNSDKFIERAENGGEEFKNLIAEVEARPEMLKEGTSS
ncbi:hypothetical protein GGI35DRAFT_481401 [Trichoderma velutinum]